MRLWFGACVLFIATCTRLPALTHQQKHDGTEYNVETGYNSRSRSKKSTLALKAVATMLGRAKLITDSGKHRMFVKSGGFKQADKDFQQLKPKNVKVFELDVLGIVKTGYVGGWYVRVGKFLGKSEMRIAHSDGTKDLLVDTIQYLE